MANRERGEVRIELDGRPPVILRLTLNAMCQTEGALKASGRDLSFPAFAAALKFAYMTDIRLFVWAAMLDAQPKTTLDDAGRFIDDAGGVGTFVERHLQPILAAGEPDADDVRALAGGRADPPSAARGTGERWKSTRGGPAFGGRRSGDSRFANFFARWWSRRRDGATSTTAISPLPR